MVFSLLIRPSKHIDALEEKAHLLAKKVQNLQPLNAADQAHFEQEKKLLQVVDSILSEMQEKAVSLQQARKEIHERLRTQQAQLQKKFHETGACNKELVNEKLSALFKEKEKTDCFMKQLEESHRKFLLFCKIPLTKE